MIPCTSCHRFFYAEESRCPFCATQVELAAAPSSSALNLALSMALSVALGTLASACSPDTTSATSAATTEEQTSEAPGTTTSSTTTTDDPSQGSTNSEGNDSFPDDESQGGAVFYGCSWDEDFGVSECDPFAQDCPEGEKCVPYASTAEEYNANKCVAVLGDTPAGGECTYGGSIEATDDCDQLSHCMPESNFGPSTCTAFCTGTADDPICAPGFDCLIAYEGSVNLCLPSCDPLLQDCGAGELCTASDGFAFVCVPPEREARATGESCFGAFECLEGLCLAAEFLPGCELGEDEEALGCCTDFCELDNPDLGCAEELECVPLYEEGAEPPGLASLGICAPPEG